MMHELVKVWTDRKGLAWIAVTALLYALVLIPFNQYHLDIAGIPLRPAAILPVVFGILWGPAAAWGLAFGNVAGDLSGGSWSPMSGFGFINNFLYAYLSYLLWHRLMRGHGIRLDAFGLGGLWVVTLVTTTFCMLFLAASGTIFFGRPFESKFIGYFGNSIFWAMVGGPILFHLLAGPAILNRMVYGAEWEKRQEGAAGPAAAL